jgi:transposase
MAMSIVEASHPVTGGIDTHLDAHVAAVVDVNGGVLAVESFPTTTAGFAELHDGLVGFGEMERVGVEGTGAYGAGLARHLRGRGLEVIEVDRANRQARRRAGKSDPADAIEAARAVLAGRATGIAKTGDGPIEAMRSLLIAKRSGREARIRCLNQLRHLGFCGPDDLREAFRGVPRKALATRAAGLRPRAGSDDVTYATKLAMRTLGRRVRAIETDNTELDSLVADLVETTAAGGLLAVHGVGVDTAAILLVAAGDNPERIRSEATWAHLCGVAPLPASSGKLTRHRLNRGGNPQANHALWRIVFTRLASDPRTRAYVERRLNQGRSKPAINPRAQALRRPRGLPAPPTRLRSGAAGLAQ